MKEGFEVGDWVKAKPRIQALEHWPEQMQIIRIERDGEIVMFENGRHCGPRRPDCFEKIIQVPW